MSSPDKPEALDRNLIYRSPWVNLYVDRVRFPNGRVIEQHHLLDFDTPAVLTVTTRPDGCYLMVQVPRYPTGRSEWEFPAGRTEPGEDLLEAARRELLEETGYESSGHELVYSFYPFGGIANQVFHIIECEVSGPTAGYDDQEITGVRWVSAAEIWELIQTHQLQDGYTLTAFLLHQHL